MLRCSTILYLHGAFRLAVEFQSPGEKHPESTFLRQDYWNWLLLNQGYCTLSKESWRGVLPFSLQFPTSGRKCCAAAKLCARWFWQMLGTCKQLLQSQGEIVQYLMFSAFWSLQLSSPCLSQCLWLLPSGRRLVNLFCAFGGAGHSKEVPYFLDGHGWPSWMWISCQSCQQCQSCQSHVFWRHSYGISAEVVVASGRGSCWALQKEWDLEPWSWLMRQDLLDPWPIDM